MCYSVDPFSGRKGKPGNKIGTPPSLGSGMVLPVDCLLIGLAIDVLLLSLSDTVAAAVSCRALAPGCGSTMRGVPWVIWFFDNKWRDFRVIACSWPCNRFWDNNKTLL